MTTKKSPSTSDENIQDDEIKRLIEARNQARKDQDFKKADEIRAYLKQNGVTLMDEKGGRGKVGLYFPLFLYICKKKKKKKILLLNITETMICGTKIYCATVYIFWKKIINLKISLK